MVGIEQVGNFGVISKGGRINRPGLVRLSRRSDLVHRGSLHGLTFSFELTSYGHLSHTVPSFCSSTSFMTYRYYFSAARVMTNNL